MLSLYLVRHGQTDFSLDNSFCGWIDPPLNANGVAMAKALGDAYGDFGWTAIYSSTLDRARKTAAPVAARAGITAAADDRIREINFGEWEGRKEDEIEHEQPERFAAWSTHPGRVAAPGGESGADVAARAMAFIDEIRKKHDGRVMAVAHKTTIRVIICSLLGLDVDLYRARIGMRVASVSQVDFKKSGPLLQTLGDIAHIPAHLRDEKGT